MDPTDPELQGLSDLSDEETTESDSSSFDDIPKLVSIDAPMPTLVSPVEPTSKETLAPLESSLTAEAEPEIIKVICRAIEVALSDITFSRRITELYNEVEADLEKVKVLKFIDRGFNTSLNANELLQLFRVINKRDVSRAPFQAGKYVIYIESFKSWITVDDGMSKSRTIDLDANREKWEQNVFTHSQLIALAHECVAKIGMLMNHDTWRNNLFSKERLCFRINLKPFRAAGDAKALMSAMKNHAYPQVAAKIQDGELYAIVLFFGVPKQKVRGMLFEFSRKTRNLEIKVQVMPELRFF